MEIHGARPGEVRATLQGHRSDLTSVAVSANGELIASTDTLGVVQLWRADTGAALRRLEIQGQYAGMNITGATGLTQAQRQALIALGGVAGPA